MKTYTTEEYVSYRIQKAKDTLVETQLLLDNMHWNTSINRMYFACYYAVGALLIQHEVKTTSHSGARQKLGQLFIHTGLLSKHLGKHYTDLFEKRHKGDYNDFFDFDEETALGLFPLSIEFVDAVETLINSKE